jgi:hypothetical protein
MKCQKCNYVSFDHLDRCKKCGYDLSVQKAALGMVFDQIRPLGLLDYLQRKEAGNASAYNETTTAVMEETPVQDDASTQSIAEQPQELPQDEIDPSAEEEEPEMAAPPVSTIEIDAVEQSAIKKPGIKLSELTLESHEPKIDTSPVADIEMPIGPANATDTLKPEQPIDNEATAVASAVDAIKTENALYSEVPPLDLSGIIDEPEKKPEPTLEYDMSVQDSGFRIIEDAPQETDWTVKLEPQPNTADELDGLKIDLSDLLNPPKYSRRSTDADLTDMKLDSEPITQPSALNSLDGIEINLDDLNLSLEDESPDKKNGAVKKKPEDELNLDIDLSDLKLE